MMRLVPTLVGALATLVVVIAIVCAGCGFAVWTGTAPAFYWPLTLDGRHFLVVQHGPNGPSCPTAPLYVDCAWRVPGQHEFSMRYITPREYRLLVSFAWLDR
jgi:hypothetical protein